MVKVSLKSIDLNDPIEQEFLYDIVKYRWSKADVINIKYKSPERIPTYEEHVKHLTSGKYKAFYRMLLGEETVGTMYLDNENVHSIFMLPNLLKKAIKRYKGQKTEIDEKPLPLLAVMCLYALHPDVTLHYAKVNPKNKLSIDVMKRNGYEEVEYTLVMRTKNGKIAQGVWANE